MLANVHNSIPAQNNLHRIRSPQNKREERKRAEEFGDLVALGLDRGATGKSNMPDDEDVGNAGDGIPPPLLAALLGSVGSKKAGHDHDDISTDCHDCVSAIDASKQAQVKQQQRGGNSPVDVTSIVRLTANFVRDVGDLAVAVGHVGAVKVDTLSVRHTEVGQGGRDGNHGRDVVIKAL